VQLIDILAYDTPFNNNINTNLQKNSRNAAKLPLSNNSVLVYQFHHITLQQRFFIFVLNNSRQNVKKKATNWGSIPSITELFSNAN
jgi:NADH:ubiquinone oxidoreductase subunit C